MQPWPVCAWRAEQQTGQPGAPRVHSQQLLQQLEQLDNAAVQHGAQLRARQAVLALQGQQVLHGLQRCRAYLRRRTRFGALVARLLASRGGHSATLRNISAALKARGHVTSRLKQLWDIFAPEQLASTGTPGRGTRPGPGRQRICTPAGTSSTTRRGTLPPASPPLPAAPPAALHGRLPASSQPACTLCERRARAGPGLQQGMPWGLTPAVPPQDAIPRSGRFAWLYKRAGNRWAPAGRPRGSWLAVAALRALSPACVQGADHGGRRPDLSAQPAGRLAAADPDRCGPPRA